MNDILVPILTLVPILAIGMVLIMAVLYYYKITKWRADKKAEKQFVQQFEQELIEVERRMKLGELLQTQLLESILTSMNQNQAKSWITIDPDSE